MQVPIRSPTKIDVHHHVYSPAFVEALNRHGGDPSGWYIPPWTNEADRQLCEQMGVSAAIVSCTAPGPDIEKDPQAAQKLARAINKFNAELRDKDPQRYGFFAAVPSLLNTETAIAEIRFALDHLNADGVTLLTRYGEDNHYLGHPDFTSIWDFLNARRTVVFVHPTHAVDRNLVSKFLPQPAWDYPHETGRAAIDMITSNMFRDHAANCKIILSHAGGDLPFLIDRPAGLLPNAQASFNPRKTGEEMIKEARRFYYDTALSTSPMHIATLKALLGEEGKSHVLYGTDFPNAPTPAIEYFTKQLGTQEWLSNNDFRLNALSLFPRLNTG